MRSIPAVRRSCSRRVRRLAAVATLAAVALGTIPGRAATDGLIFGSSFCDQNATTKGKPITIDGPTGQTSIHTEVFSVAYAEACSSGAGMVSYQGTGDRAGVEAMLVHDVGRHVGTGDVPLFSSEKQLAELDLYARDQAGRRSAIHQIPLFLEPNAVGYSLPSSCGAATLNLRSPVLGQIFAGRITRWNHALLVQDNPAMGGCDLPIRLVKRGDQSASTTLFKDYLSKRDPSWNAFKLPERNQDWPTPAYACLAVGEVGVAECVRSLDGAVGYLPLRAALLRGVRTARLDNPVSGLDPNPSRRFFAPSVGACTAPAANLVTPPAVPSVRISASSELTNGFSPTRGDWSALTLADSPHGYPLCGIAFAFMFDRINTAYAGKPYTFGQARTAVDYLWTSLGESAQSRLSAYGVTRLPSNLLSVARTGVDAIRYKDL